MAENTYANIEIAFRKLQSYIYFDKKDLHNRAKLSEWISSNASYDSGFEIVQSILQGEEKARGYLEKINLRLLPKSVDPQDNGHEIPSNFYTNEHLIKNSEVTSLLIFIDLPIELQVISVMWLMKYGVLIDAHLGDYNFGNRLFLDKDKKLNDGRIMFKPYQEQFKKWWSNAIVETKNLLEKKEDATILSFDFKSFFHTVRLDFGSLESYIRTVSPQAGEEIEKDPIHTIVKQIHKKYSEQLHELTFTLAPKADDKYSLPIGLPTSHLLANWYLKDFDKAIIEATNPIYYGRYVDDILIVLKDRLLTKELLGKILDGEKPKNSEINSNSNSDNEEATPENVQRGANFLTQTFFNEYLKKIFNYEEIEKEDQKGRKDVVISINTDNNELKKYTELKLQPAKVFIYQFNHRMSPNLLTKFEKEQEKRSYIFQFLSDTTDDMFDEFEIDAFEDSMEDVDINKSKFKNQEINSFRFAVYIAKLIKRRILNGAGYKKEEVEKISKYFKGIYCLHHYVYWEKLLTLYVVAEDRSKFFHLVNTILEEIDELKCGISKGDVDNIDTKASGVIRDIKNVLAEHLRYSIQMALGLNPKFIFSNNMKENESEEISIQKNKNNIAKILAVGGKLTDKDFYEAILTFRRTKLLRHSYIFYPIVQFVADIARGYQPLHKPDFFINSKPPFDLNRIDDKGYIPYRVKFYEVCLFTFYRELYTKTTDNCINNKRWFQNDIIPSNILLEESFKLFTEINSVSVNLKRHYFNLIEETSKEEISGNISGDCGEFYTNSRWKNYTINEVKIPNGGDKKDTLRVTMVNKYTRLEHFEASLDGTPLINEKRTQEFLWIIDQTKKVPKCDLYVMPELSMPHYLLPTFVSKSAYNQIGVISGIEHWKVANVGYNFVITCLPIDIDGDYDAIPVIRLKNHYAPDEEEWINGKYMVVPKPLPYRYDLFIWRGVYFSTYYCYELADVFHRYAMNGRIDVMFAPVWNKDTNFYNNIIEVTTRDMHIYVVHVNTSQYGQSRITRPTKTERRDKAKIMGGTVEGYPVTLSVSDIDIKSLRHFQTMTFAAQKSLANETKTFKPTPPDFPIEDVRKRIKGQSFDWGTKAEKKETPETEENQKEEL